MDAARYLARPISSLRPIRVVQFTYGDTLYGAERWVLTLSRHLDPSRVHTTIACLRDDGSGELALIEAARQLGFDTVVIDARNRLLSSAVNGLRHAIRSQGIDLVHTHGVRQDVVGLLATRGLGVRLLSTPHGWEARCSLKERVRTLVNKLAFTGFDAVAPLSPELRDSLRWLPVPGSRLHLIENGVDLDEIEAAKAVSGLLPGQRTPSDFVLGYIGRLVAGKGIEVLFEALAGLPDDGWCCLVIGEGPERARLEDVAIRLGVASRVSFLGYRPDRLSYLKRFDLFVLPSFREGTPRCLMEALAASVPCAGSAIAGIETILHDGVTGDTFPVGDSLQLTGIINRVRHDSARARALAFSGQALIRDRFSAGVMARRYEALYASICEVRAA